MKLFLISAEIGEELPYYTFMIEEENKDKAWKRASKIVQQDYGYPLTTDRFEEIGSLEDIKKQLVI